MIALQAIDVARAFATDLVMSGGQESIEAEEFGQSIQFITEGVTNAQAATVE